MLVTDQDLRLRYSLKHLFSRTYCRTFFIKLIPLKTVKVDADKVK